MTISRCACWVLGSSLAALAMFCALERTAAQVAVQAVPAAAPAPPLPGGGQAAPPAENEFTDAITLPTNRQIRKALEMARDDSIPGKQWGEAARLLQTILDHKEDYFIPVKRKGADGKERTRWVSAKAEANRLLGDQKMRDEGGLQFYEVQYGGQAKQKLTEAKKSGDPQLLAQVAQRYFHTEVGSEATDLLGTYHLDRGNPLMAALCYEKLLHREGADQLSAFTLFKAALAFRMAGDKANAELTKTLMAQLVAKGRDGIQIGDETIPLEQVQKELSKATAPEIYAAHDWTLVRGNPSRSGIARGSAPFLESKWQHNNLTENVHSNTKSWVEDALRQQQYRPETMIPAFLPIATGGKLVYRSYWGIHCVDIKTGELQWDSQTVASLDALARDLDKKNDVHNWFQLYKQSSNQNIIFENSVIGTLSSDNSRVYAIDDLGVPPHPQAIQGNPWGWGGGGQQMSGKIAEIANHSRLIAIDLESGKLVWERGGEHDTTDLAGSYFLGAPLPLAGKLYLLTEKNGELRLVCLDATDGKPAWTQTLATAREKLLNDVNRRIQAVNLAFAEGILVCPTNAGAILGIDLLSRSLVWAFPYREKSKEPQNDQMMMRRRGMVFAPGMDPNGNAQKFSGDWKLTSPIIQRGKVVFTAPDGGAIHCLNLQDGDALWQADRRDDLYVAGIFGDKVMLVGKEKVRALSLADGKKVLWEVDTGGQPSGLGVASEHYYYIPLKKGEVCRLDLDTKQVTHSPSPKGEIPGNLLFYDGDVVSQTETTVTCYPQVEYMLAQVTSLLQKNPNDPIALAKRGEMRLYKGDLDGAVDDLRLARVNHPPADMDTKIRNKLYSTLTEQLKLKFNDAERHLDEYKNLCKVPVAATASAEEKKKAEDEERHRYAGFLCLLAKGREDQGRFLEAFQAYLDFGSLAERKELVTVINERGVKARPEVWAQGRIAALVARATPEQRKPLEAEIGRRWQTVKDSKDPTALPRFVGAFGSLFSVGREARLQLAERLMNNNSFLEAELQLLQLRGNDEEPRISARAVEALARLMTRKGLLEDAAHYYRVLGRDFGDIVIRDGKNGADFFRELATDKRFLPYLEENLAPLLGASVRVSEVTGGISLPQHHLTFEARGEQEPFFQRYRLAWTMMNVNGMSSFQMKLMDRDTNETRWTVTAPATRATYSHQAMNSHRFPFYSKGHLVVLYLGHVVYALDLVEKKKLWERDLLSADRFTMDQPYFQYMLSLDREGALHLSNPQGAAEKLGQIGPVTSSYICLRTQEGLVALDPVHGHVLWTKSDVSNQTQIFGDDQYVYLVETRDKNQIGSTRALRGQDGATVDVPDFGPAFQRRQKIVGGRILVSENEPSGGLILRLYDVASGKDLWKKNLPPNAIILKGEEPELAGVVEPDGKLTVLDLAKLKEVFHAKTVVTHLEKVRDGWVLRDNRHYFAILNRPQEPNQNFQGPWANVTSLRTEPVNGWVYAFDRDTARIGWYMDVTNQMVLLEHFAEMPTMVFSAKFHRMVNMPVSYTPYVSTMIVDKRTGKRLYDNEVYSNSPQSQGQYHGLHIDRQAGIIDLISHNMRLRQQVGNNGQQADAGGARLYNNAIDVKAAQALEGAQPLLVPARKLAPAAVREK